MSNAINLTAAVTRLSQIKQPSLVGKFMSWCQDQQEDRLLWLGIALAGHGCVMAGLSFPLFMIALLAMTMALVANLAALPTKITIPVLFLGVLADAAVLLYLLATTI